MSKSASEILNERAQACISATPVIILGSGASIAAGIPGMGQLRDHILSLDLPRDLTDSEIESWGIFQRSLQDNTNLEAVLHEVNLSDKLNDLIVDATWGYLQPFDVEAFNKLLSNRSPYPLTRLFQHLLRSTHTEIEVVTPNYDRIAEYAADMGEIYHETGFSYGFIRRRMGDSRQAVKIGSIQSDRVNIWKVHGSFEWFKDEQDIIRALPISHPKPSGWKPVIVTPGIQKYRRTYDEPFVSIKAGSDRAFSNASAFFCSGFGFNDEHIQTKLKERCRSKQVPLVLITMDVTSTAKEFFKGEFCQEYLAIEKADEGCQIYCPEFPDGEIVSEGDYWQLESFLTLITT